MIPALLLSAVILLAPISVAAQSSLAFSGLRHDSSLPVELTADRLNLNQSAGTALYSGDVKVAQGTLRLAADKLLVEYQASGGSVTGTVRQMTASGDVTLTNGAEAAEGSKAIYVIETGMVTMTGDVLLTQGQNALAGETLTIDLNSGSAAIEGRVRTVFQTQATE